MIIPSPTSRIDPAVARGTRGPDRPATVGRPLLITLLVPNTSYELHLVPASPVTVDQGKRLLGTITASARRLDVVESGGRYIEPVMGRPRRVQGTVIATSPTHVVVDAAVPIHLALTDQRQSPSQFSPGQFVSCDVLDGATFTPTA
jgi:hypothetical protein